MFTVFVSSNAYIIHGSGREQWSAGRVQRFMERATWMRQGLGDSVWMGDGFQTVHVVNLEWSIFYD